MDERKYETRERRVRMKRGGSGDTRRNTVEMTFCECGRFQKYLAHCNNIQPRSNDTLGSLSVV